MSWVIPSLGYNFIPFQEVEQLEGTDIFNVKCGQQIMSGIKKFQSEHAQTLHISGLEVKKCC